MATETQPGIAGLHLVGLENLRKRWAWFLALGVLLVVLGMIALGSSLFMTVATMVFVGWLLIVGGVLEAAHACLCKGWGGLSPAFVTSVWAAEPNSGAEAKTEGPHLTHFRLSQNDVQPILDGTLLWAWTSSAHPEIVDRRIGGWHQAVWSFGFKQVTSGNMAKTQPPGDIDEPIRFTLYGLWPNIENRCYGEMGLRLMNEMWRTVKPNHRRRMTEASTATKKSPKPNFPGTCCV